MKPGFAVTVSIALALISLMRMANAAGKPAAALSLCSAATTLFVDSSRTNAVEGR
jgi:hypothetical protein